MSNRQILTLPKHANPTQTERTASAPYNFVSLPEVVVTAVERAGDLPHHDSYDSTRHTGFLEVALTTRSPLYIRCPFTLPNFLRQKREEDANLSFQQKVRNTPDFFYTDDPNRPVIPGSSLRGMLRSMLEILSYGKAQWVTNTLKVFYRAVAAAQDDPLGEPYRQVLGKFGSRVRAGYLIEKADGWYIKPAKRPADMGWPEKQAYLKVKEDRIPSDVIPGFVRFNSPNYRPQHHPVSFNAETRKGKRGDLVAVTKIAAPDAGYVYRGVLVCSGNMLETGSGDSLSPRKNHALVLEADNNAALLKINTQAVADYLDAVTPFQTEPPFDKNTGCLVDARPIFYVEREGEVFFFGHNPHFRVPAFLKEGKRVATPMDFAPRDLRWPEDIDYAEALFGYVRSRKELDDMRERGLPVTEQGSKGRAYAGRVCVSDAVLDEGQKDIWLAPNPIVPRILATPKPTAFQHYLVQTNENKSTLKHYDSQSPGETVVRGHKVYWHQNANWLSLDDVKNRIEEDRERLAEIARQEGQGKPDTQHTQFRPVGADVKFTFRVYFENLSDAELGALCWVLQPLGDPSKDYCHSLGMGKPLGMGAVKLEASLHLTDRRKRYESLFEGDCWQTGLTNMEERLSDRAVQERRTKAFEKHVLETLGCYPRDQHLYELKRIGMLLKMLEWPGPDPQETQYMNLGEFKHRPVLPDPSAFGSLKGEAEPIPNPPTQPGRMAAARASSRGHTFSALPAASQKGKPQSIPRALVPDSKPPAITTKKELVTLVEDAKGRKAQVRTSQGESVPCSQFPPYPAAEAGMRCRAKVTRQDGEAQNATFNRWE